jgi:hypothetical protein
VVLQFILNQLRLHLAQGDAADQPDNLFIGQTDSSIAE